MMIRKSVVLVGVSAVMTVAVFYVLRGQVTDSFRPVRAKYVDSFYSLDNPDHARYVMTQLVGVRADGSISIARLADDSDVMGQTVPMNSIRILDAPRKQYVVVHLGTKSKTTYPSSMVRQLEYMTVSHACQGAADGPILGLLTVRQESSVTTPAGLELTTRTWVSRELNCLPLRTEKILKHPDGRGSREVREISSVDKQEPPAWMFTIPPDLTERKPSEVMAEAARKKGIQPGNSVAGDLRDEAYLSGVDSLLRK
jgi:hypothetical protein